MGIQKKTHVHFMGICGSGCASIAMLAYDAGFIVSGCDMSADSYYANELKKKNIQISVGHSASHLEGVDIVAVSPALFDIAPDNPELVEAGEKGILMTWQEFMGTYLQKDKKVLAIAGTHGKTTTTFLTSEIFIDAGLDPVCEGGSVFRKWGSGARSGRGDVFICEADEFNRNFHHYKPETAVMTIVEMDHPECYTDFDDMLQAYVDFLMNDGNLKTVILNGDSEGAVEVIRRCRTLGGLKNVRILAFSHSEKTYEELQLPVVNVLYKAVEKNSEGTGFLVSVNGEDHSFFTCMYGEYNVSNAAAAVLSAWEYGISDADIQKTLNSFSGVGRRFDLVGEREGIPVYDDYAHHPTEISSVLTMCREYFSDKKLVAVFEPHQVSRLRLMLQDYADALCIADHVIIAKTHLGREVHKNVKPITPEEWQAFDKGILYEEDPQKIVSLVDGLKAEGECDMVVVIGAANSYKISRLLCNI